MQDFLPMLTQASKTLVSIVMRGGLVMIPLLTASVVAMTVILERLFCWRRLRVRRGEPGTLALVAEGDLPQAMQAAAQGEVGQARRYLPILDTVIALAPLLGLLGTITGMMGAFGIVSEAGLGQPHAITGGIAEALIATATGLLIAIMTLIPCNYFRSKVEQLTDVLEEQSTRLELLLGKRED